MTKLHEEWFAYADDDFSFAKSGFRDGFFAHVCFLSQQAVEKAMKGYLVYLGKDYPKTHGLVTLHRLMDVGWLDEHIISLKKLSEFYVPIRYPDAIAGALPNGMPDREDAANALKWAGEILESIKSHLKNEA